MSLQVITTTRRHWGDNNTTLSRYIVQVDSDTYTRLDEQTLVGDEVVLDQR